MAQTRHWIFTLNNWSVAEDAHLRALDVTYIVFGYETGENGTPHLQGYVVFATKKRLNEAKAQLGERVHLEPKRGTPVQAADYCKKDGIFFENGEQPQGRKGTTALDTFIKWVTDRIEDGDPIPSQREIAQLFPVLWLRHERRLGQLIHHMYPQVRFEEEVVLHPWQDELRKALIVPPPCNRGIIFYVDEEGGAGKTHMQRYMLTNHSDISQVVSVGKRDDIAHALDETKTVFMFNVARGGMQFLQYTILEQLKDRMVFSPKYDSRTKLFPQDVHVVIFCNEHPDMSKMTADRYVIVEL